MGIITTFTKNLPFSVFELITYQNAKTHAKHLLWRKRIKLPKTYILSVFDHVIYKNVKIQAKNLMFKKRKDITRNVYYNFF